MNIILAYYALNYEALLNNIICNSKCSNHYMDIKFLNAFNVAIPGSWTSFQKLEKYFGNFEKAWNASEQDIKNSQITEEISSRIVQMRDKIDPDKEWRRLENENISVISKNDRYYPKLLKQIPQPPHLLYVRGKLPEENRLCISVVGSRKYTSYGKQACEKIVSGLASCSINIISGLALGIDSIAHQTTLDSGGTTIAVLGTGIDNKTIYPAQNLNLAKNILKNNGALISEFAPGTKAMPYHFPMRNRIISGLSKGVLIVEASEKSGSLITASLALEQNRDVFAIPGTIFSESSKGTNNLIKQGAKIVTSAEDIVEEYSDLIPRSTKDILTSKSKLPLLDLSENENKILRLLSPEPLELDQLLKSANIPANQFNSILTMLEIKGIIRNQGGRVFKID